MDKATRIVRVEQAQSRWHLGTLMTNRLELRGRRGASSGRLFAELGIIFVGVFGAFVAEDVRQQREDDQRAQQTYRAVRAEIQAFAARAPFVVEQMKEAVDSWNARRDAGERPPPPYYREPRAETPPTAIWQATLASGGVALLDPTLFNQLAEFYNRLESVSTRYQRYNAVTEREVLPRIMDGTEAFYRPDGTVVGLYATHIMLLGEIRDELNLLTAEAAAMDSALAVVIDL